MTDFPGNGDPQSCYGFSLTSEIDLRFTRPGASADAIKVVELRGSEPVHDEPEILQWLTPNGVAGKLYGGGAIFDFWADGAGWFRVAPYERTVEVPAGADPIRREVHLWGVPSMVMFTRLGDLSLHAAAVERDGRAVLVAAPGQHGKTTLSVALHAAGCRLLSEDISRLQVGGEPIVLPGPTVVRMRPDTFLGVPEGMQMVEEGRRVHLEATRDRVGSADPVPVAAVVLLRLSENGELRMLQDDPTVALRALWALAFRIPVADDRARAFQQLADLVSAVPVYDFWRPLTFETLPAAVEQVAGLCAS